MAMKIEKGKYYKSRDGRKREVLKTDARSNKIIIYCYENGHLLALHQNGMFYDDKSECDYDLVAEWTDPVEIPWSDYPTWCNWAAMDSDGEWYCYDSKPKASLSTWINEDFVNAIHPDYQPKNFTGDWTESLFERPQK